MTTPDPTQIGCGGWTPQNQPAKEKADERLALTPCSPSSLTPETDAAWGIFQDSTHDDDGDPWGLCSRMERQRNIAVARHNKLIEQRDEAIEVARKSMETVMQIYGHAQFCDECQSFEIADSCRIEMHGMDRINSLENAKHVRP